MASQQPRPQLSPELIHRLQVTAGNRAVQKLLERRNLPDRTEAPAPTAWHLRRIVTNIGIWVWASGVISAAAGLMLWWRHRRIALILFVFALVCVLQRGYRWGVKRRAKEE